MSYTFSLDVSEITRIEALMARAPTVVQEEFGQAMRISVALLEPEVIDRTPTGAHQQLRQSIHGEVDIEPALVLGVVGSSLDYAEPVELGTKPHWAPLAPLQDWVENKLGLSGAEAESAARSIQRAIAHRGTLGVGMFHRALAANRGEIINQFQLAAARTMQRIGDGN